jgi:hypothetical protein
VVTYPEGEGDDDGAGDAEGDGPTLLAGVAAEEGPTLPLAVGPAAAWMVGGGVG